MTDHCPIWTRDTPSIGPAIVAIGVFDGVHLGHQALIAHGCASADARSVPCVALTFDRDPDQVVTPDTASPQLLTLADKCRFLTRAGARIVSVIPFDAEIAAMPPEEFIDRILLAVCEPLEVHVGVDFRFGRFAEGTVDTLRKLGESAGFVVVPHDLVRRGSHPVTSTRIRGLVSEGSLDDAATLLGRPHRAAGMVVKGRGEGRTLLGIATANILPSEHAALPRPGVYAGWATVEDRRWPAAISVGVPPSVPRAHHVLEVHLIGFEGDLLHKHLTLEFHAALRPQRAFTEAGALAAAMSADIDRVAEMLQDPDGQPHVNGASDDS